MRKIISVVLACMLVVVMCCVGMPVASADNSKATIHVYDFVGGAYDKYADTQTQLDGKSINRESYQFEVGDLVNVVISLQSDDCSAISGYTAHTFINQNSIDAGTTDAFKTYTNDINRTLEISDLYYAVESGEGYDPGVFLINNVANSLLQSNPQVAVADESSPYYQPDSDIEIDRISYTGIEASNRGIKISNEKKVVTFTVHVKEATESYLYSAVEDAVENSEELNTVATQLNIKTTLEKVGHVEIEKPTEPTEPATLAPTEPVTLAPTQPATPAPTEPVTLAPTEPATDVVAHTYTIAGSENLCKVAWDPAETSNDMTHLGDNLYEKEFTDVPAGDIEFKVVQDHSWDVSFGVPDRPSYDNNFKDTVTNAGSTVVIKFNAATGEVTWDILYFEAPTEEETVPVCPHMCPDFGKNGGRIYFEKPENWDASKPIYAYFWNAKTSEVLNPWQSKDSKMTPCDDGKTWYYDLPCGCWNMVIFSNSDGIQTTDTTMGVSCFEDTAYFNGTYINPPSGPVDDYQGIPCVSWKNNSNTYGTHMDKDSRDQIYGDYLLEGETNLRTGEIAPKDGKYPVLEIPSEAPSATETVTPDNPTETTSATETVTPDNPTETPSATDTTVPTTSEQASGTTTATSATTATQKPTAQATQSATNAQSSNNQSASSTTGKVATGDSTTVTLLLMTLLMAGGAIISARKKLIER